MYLYLLCQITRGRGQSMIGESEDRLSINGESMDAVPLDYVDLLQCLDDSFP